MTVKRLKAATLIEDFDLYPRHDVDSAHVTDLVQALRVGTKLPPVVVDKASLRVIDGFHRRRAALRAHGPDAEVDADLRTYKDEAAMFEEAVALNASHGRKLDKQDLTRIGDIADRLGISEGRQAVLLHIEPTRLIEYKGRIVYVDDDPTPVPAKPVAEPFFGQKVTEAQASAMRSFSGMRLKQQITQLRGVVASGLYNAADPAILRALHGLADLIKQAVPAPPSEEAA